MRWQDIAMLGSLSVAGYLIYDWMTRQGSAAPACTEGAVNTISCPDGSAVVTDTCVGGQWVPTGNVCPSIQLVSPLSKELSLSDPNQDWYVVVSYMDQSGQPVSGISMSFEYSLDNGATWFSEVARENTPGQYSSIYLNVSRLSPGSVLMTRFRAQGSELVVPITITI